MGFFDKFKRFTQDTVEGANQAGLKREESLGITQITAKKRELDFSKFLTPEMKARKKSGKLDWMDLVDVFEVFYMEYRQKQGWILKKGNYLSNSTDDRFKVTWEVDDQLIQGEYTFDRRWWIVTETIKTKKNT